jgi:hypothetical protein
MRFNSEEDVDADVQLGTAGARARVLELQMGIDLSSLAAVAFAATVLTIAGAATLLIVARGTAATVLLARAVLPASWRHHTVPADTLAP